MTNIRYRGNQGNNAVNLSRTPSPFLWTDCPWDAIKRGEVDGIAFHDDFENLPTVVPTVEGAYGFYKGFSSTGGTINPAAPLWGGVVTLGSDAAAEGAGIATVGLPLQISRLHGKLWFECRVKLSSIADALIDAFVGLGDLMTLSATVPIASTGTLANENLVGFQHLGVDGDQWDIVYKADGVPVVVQADAQIAVADTWLKLGFVFDPTAPNYYLNYFGNGVLIGTPKTIPVAAGTDFPNDVPLGLVAAAQSAGAGTPILTMDWWRYAQLAA